MDFEYDEAKNRQCLKERGFDFEFVKAVFADPAYVEIEDNRQNYGESRFLVTGMIEGRLFTVVYTPRDDKRRIIASWRASRQERKRYANAQV